MPAAERSAGYHVAARQMSASGWLSVAPAVPPPPPPLQVGVGWRGPGSLQGLPHRLSQQAGYSLALISHSQAAPGWLPAPGKLPPRSDHTFCNSHITVVPTFKLLLSHQLASSCYGKAYKLQLIKNNLESGGRKSFHVVRMYAFSEMPMDSPRICAVSEPRGVAPGHLRSLMGSYR